MWLTIEVPSQAPLVVEVVGPKATIGSDPACDIVIADDEISPKHAELRELDDGRAEIEDLDSGAGTWVGGVRLGGPATLEGGERLRIGRTELISSLERPDPTERALTRRENLQRLVTQSRRATVLASAAVAIAVITVVNAHVVDAGETFQVGAEGDLQEADVVGVAPCDDLAVLEASETEGLEALTLGSQATLSEGDPVVAVGYPANASPDDELAATEGIVSVVEQTFDIPNDPSVQLYPNVIQTDAAINAGNSGGPLLDLNGALVGVNTLVYRGRRGEVEGQNYAIGVDRVAEVLTDLREGDSQAWLGFAFAPLPQAVASRQGLPAGLIVTSVVPETPAADEGIQSGLSIVVGVDGEPVASFREYCDAVEGLNGQTVKFNLLEPDGPRVIDLEL